MSGRPPKNPIERVGIPVRALITPIVMDALSVDMKANNTNLSEAIRLALYERLLRQGLLTPELENDPTWLTLKEKGLV
jgi:hypothetical protein